MILVLFSLIIAGGCVTMDLPSLKGGRKRRDRVVWMLFWLLGIASAACALLRLNIPSPLLLVIMIYKPFNHIVSSWFQ